MAHAMLLVAVWIASCVIRLSTLVQSGVGRGKQTAVRIVKSEMTRQIGPGGNHAQQAKQNDAPNHAADNLSLAPAMATPQNLARARRGRASNSVGGEPAVSSAGIPSVDLDLPPLKLWQGNQHWMWVALVLRRSE